MMTLESHMALRKAKDEWKRCQENVIDVMKKTLGELRRASCDARHASSRVTKALASHQFDAKFSKSSKLKYGLIQCHDFDPVTLLHVTH